MGDKLKDSNENIVAILASDNNMLCICGKNAVANGAHAGKIIKDVSAVTGGKGGGRPDNAMAGIGDKAKLDEAFAKFKEIVSQI